MSWILLDNQRMWCICQILFILLSLKCFYNCFSAYRYIMLLEQNLWCLQALQNASKHMKSLQHFRHNWEQRQCHEKHAYHWDNRLLKNSNHLSVVLFQDDFKDFPIFYVWYHDETSFNVTPSSISLNEHGGSVNILKPTPHYNRALHV